MVDPIAVSFLSPFPVLMFVHNRQLTKIYTKLAVILTAI